MFAFSLGFSSNLWTCSSGACIVCAPHTFQTNFPILDKHLYNPRQYHRVVGTFNIFYADTPHTPGYGTMKPFLQSRNCGKVPYFPFAACYSILPCNLTVVIVHENQIQFSTRENIHVDGMHTGRKPGSGKNRPKFNMQDKDNVYPFTKKVK